MTVTRHQAVGAYQRWTPPAFDGGEKPTEVVETPPAAPETKAVPEQTVAATPLEPAVKLPTVQDVEATFEQARKDGEAAGYAEGTTRARNEAAQITRLVRAMDSALDELGGDVANEIVELAIALARQLVGDTLAAHPESIVGTVRDALLQVPQGKVRIHLNPEDIKLVRQHLDDQLETSHHHLVEDATLTRGGCRLETSSCDVDASMQTRWERVLSGIGRDPDKPSDDA